MLKSNFSKKVLEQKNNPLNEIQNLQDDYMEDDVIDDSLIEPETSTILYQNNDSKDIENNMETEENETLDNATTQADHFDDDFDISIVDINEVENRESENEKNHKVTEEELISGWENMQGGTNINVDPQVSLNTEEIPCMTNSEGKQVFRFYWWDAYEDYFKQPGVVFLFGKVYVESAKSYASCCVTVRNIDRKIFLLPRPFQLENDMKTETDKRVKIVNVYEEFNDSIAEKLKITNFKSKKVIKKYAFDVDIPQQSEYLEIQYPAINESLDPNLEGKTFSKIFGTQTSFLEILLLDRKIKGPCWIDITNPSLANTSYSYCKFEINCNSMSDLFVPHELQNLPPPPMVVVSLNIKTVLNQKTKTDEIVMIGCLVHTKFAIDKKPSNPPFEHHFCGKYVR